jgi:hypothetical protein
MPGDRTRRLRRSGAEIAGVGWLCCKTFLRESAETNGEAQRVRKSQMLTVMVTGW